MNQSYLNLLIAQASARHSNRDWQVSKLKQALLKTFYAAGAESAHIATSQLSYVLDDVLALHPQSIIPKEKSRSMISYVVTKVYTRLSSAETRTNS